MAVLLATSSPLFALLVVAAVPGAVPVHVVGTLVWGFAITRAEAASYPAIFFFAEVAGAAVAVLGLGILCALGDAGAAVAFAILVAAHVLALEVSRRHLRRLLRVDDRAPIARGRVHAADDRV